MHSSAHTKFERRVLDPLCGLFVAPWLSSKYPCAVYNFDCGRLHVATPSSNSLEFLDPRVLVTLNFVHCDALVMPPIIQNFSSLVGINLNHVELVVWPKSAALLPDKNPRIVFVCFVHVNLTAIPDGLLGPLPPLLQDIEFSHTNLSRLPDWLDQAWPHVQMLYIEYSKLQTIPPSLLRMKLFDLSLIGNELEDVSNLANLGDRIAFLSLDGNPLKQLPDALERDFSLLVLSAERTELTVIPDAWLARTQAVYVDGTPVCGNKDHVTARNEICSANYERSAGKCMLN
ncbi:TPA: hypothetical protein N0F65_012092 [Lagenidium giganteum]|uniref:Uncharacterized protein n=1 Tax=Lagenidium giganteum TaxID=4803 RepID=A0AAV2YS79_9STRA|nr:TPA: hypothetical protein N0F65_012092 [Lagenidium giganteum]